MYRLYTYNMSTYLAGNQEKKLPCFLPWFFSLVSDSFMILLSFSNYSAIFSSDVRFFSDFLQISASFMTFSFLDYLTKNLNTLTVVNSLKYLVFFFFFGGLRPFSFLCIPYFPLWVLYLEHSQLAWLCCPCLQLRIY